MFQNFNIMINNLNNSKYFAGIVMIMLNIGSKYITIKLSKSQEQYLRNSVARQMLIFSIIWMGTRDIIISLILTGVFIILTDHLFNEESNYCLLPEKFRHYKDVLDENGDGKVSPEEFEKALEIVKKAKIQQRKNLTKNIETFQTLEGF